MQVTGRKPSASIARGVSVHLQQGRMFFEAADAAQMEIKPLLLYYGMMALAKALVIGRKLLPPESLQQSHGLTDKSGHSATLSNLMVHIQGSGIFAQYNDIVCAADGIWYFENYMRRKHNIPTASTQSLMGKNISFKEILSRISSVAKIYQETYQESPGTRLAVLNILGSSKDTVTLRIDVEALYEDRASLASIVSELRDQYPMLKRWRLHEASKAWDRSILHYSNCLFDPETELSEQSLVQREDRFNAQAFNLSRTDFRQLFDPVHGGIFEGPPFLVKPFDGAYISSASLDYLGTFLLGSLVRYRPRIWVHALARQSSSDRPSDDSALALIEEFMSGVRRRTEMTVGYLLTHPQ